MTLVAGQTLDRETAASHSFTVQVSDGTNTDTQTVTLSVTDVNEAAPVITSGVSATAAENVGAAAVLYTATATDADATATLTYSLTDDDNGRFEIDAATGAVSLVAGQTLDRETAASHSFTVQVSDGTNTDTQTVTLSVTDVNEAAPVITSGVSATAAENVGAAGRPLYRDGDRRRRHGNAHLQPHRRRQRPLRDRRRHRRGDPGRRADPGPRDRRQPQLHRAGLRRHQHRHADRHPDRHRRQRGGARHHLRRAGVRLPRTSRAAAVLYTATATDADATASLTYSLTDDDSGRFEIDAATGVVTLARRAALDRETAASHSFTVEGERRAQHRHADRDAVRHRRQRGGARHHLGLSVRRLPRTLAPPLSSIRRRRPTPTPTASLTYSLTDDDSGRFAIDPASGVVTVAGQTLDHEAAASHSFTVEVTDGAGHRHADRDFERHRRQRGGARHHLRGIGAGGRERRRRRCPVHGDGHRPRRHGDASPTA